MSQDRSWRSDRHDQKAGGLIMRANPGPEVPCLMDATPVLLSLKYVDRIMKRRIALKVIL
jgi:hypothetical protein